MASKYTKKSRKLLWLFRILDYVTLLLPLIIYVFIALCTNGISVVSKVAVVSTTMIAIILTIFNIIGQKHLRSPIWLILIGLFCAIRDRLLPLIIILAISSVLDEFVFAPLIKKYYAETVANIAIDKREKQEVVETQGE